jgi:hypothetical protein
MTSTFLIKGRRCLLFFQEMEFLSLGYATLADLLDGAVMADEGDRIVWA